jgi:drug/metabolite transporter (DMT)-like permease
MSALAPEIAAPRRSQWPIYLLVLVITTMWSGNFVAVKFAIVEMPPLLVIGLRTILAGAVMLPIFLGTPRGNEQRLSLKKDFWRLMLLGVGGVTLNQLFFTLALERTSVAHGSLIIATTPISILLIASLMGHERITVLKAIGMALALSGVLYIQLTPAKSEGASLLGDLLAVCGSLTFAAFTVFGKQVTRHHSAVTVNSFAYIGGGLLLLPIVLLVGAGLDPQAISLRGWLSILYMAIFPSVVCYVGYFYALNHISASRVAVFAYLQPAIATLMAVPLLGESISTSVVIGGLGALLGVAITQRG